MRNPLHEIETWKKHYSEICGVDDIETKLRSIQATKKQFNIMFDPDEVFTRELLGCPQFPYSRGGKSLKLLGVLLLTWHNEISNGRLMQQMITQSAKPLQTLRNMGFVFKKDKGPNFLYRKDGEVYRQCLGFDPGLNTDMSQYLQVTATELAAMKLGKTCPYTNNGNNLEFDHREPVNACRKRGGVPATLTREDAEFDTWEDDWQLITQTMNAVKRSACEKCMNGGCIAIPAVIPNPERYRQTWDDTTCEGCFWYDYRKPLRP